MFRGLSFPTLRVRGAWPVAAALALALIAAPTLPHAQDAPPVVAVGQGLEINPHRLVFGAEGGRATLDLHLPTPAASFQVRVEDKVMLEDGRIMLPSEAPGAPPVSSARSLVQAAPAVLALDRGGGQNLTVSVAPAGDLPAGEYRTHITLAAQRPPGAGPKARYNLWDYSIPVIVRVGPADARAGLSDVVVVQQTIVESETRRRVTVPVLYLRLERLGRSSIYGDAIVTDGATVLGRAEGVAVYPELTARQLQIPLIQTPTVGERLTVTFVDRDVKPGAILAQVSAQLSAPLPEQRPI